MESRTITRWDVHKYAREAYDAGVRYIGGCCGFESYHIRAIAEEVNLIKISVLSVKYLAIFTETIISQNFFVKITSEVLTDAIVIN